VVYGDGAWSPLYGVFESSQAAGALQEVTVAGCSEAVGGDVGLRSNIVCPYTGVGGKGLSSRDRDGGGAVLMNDLKERTGLSIPLRETGDGGGCSRVSNIPRCREK
jgi:hypothetical protein